MIDPALADDLLLRQADDFAPFPVDAFHPPLGIEHEENHPSDVEVLLQPVALLLDLLPKTGAFRAHARLLGPESQAKVQQMLGMHAVVDAGPEELFEIAFGFRSQHGQYGHLLFERGAHFPAECEHLRVDVTEHDEAGALLPDGGASIGGIVADPHLGAGCRQGMKKPATRVPVAPHQ